MIATGAESPSRGRTVARTPAEGKNLATKNVEIIVATIIETMVVSAVELTLRITFDGSTTSRVRVTDTDSTGMSNAWSGLPTG